ncbi:MAG: hypothetical protein ACERLM_00745 [Acidimicrobiales bacterium]
MTPTGRRVLGAGAVWVLGAVVFRLTLLAPEQCPELTVDQARAAAVASADWIVANQDDTGRYLYSYDRTTGEPAIPGYNGVRHAGTTMALYQLVLAGETQYLDEADRAVDFMLERSIETGPDALAWSMNGADPKLGSVALLTVALAHRRLATGDQTYDDTLRALGRHMVGQEQPDGVMLNYWRQSTGRPDPTQRSRYATGEALWGLALLHDAFPDEGWDDAAWPILDYLSLRRDAEEELFPRPWPDQWAAYSLAQMGPWGLEEHHVAYARELAGQFGIQVRWDAQNEGVAGLTHGPITSAAGFGTVVEGLASLHQLSIEDGRLADLTAPIAERMACGASRLADRQSTADDVVSAEAVDQEIGAWFSDDATRVDDQQHAASGLVRSEVALPGGTP